MMNPRIRMSSLLNTVLTHHTLRHTSKCLETIRRILCYEKKKEVRRQAQFRVVATIVPCSLQCCLLPQLACAFLDGCEVPNADREGAGASHTQVRFNYRWKELWSTMFTVMRFISTPEYFEKPETLALAAEVTPPVLCHAISRSTVVCDVC
jgi:hypothetical protein